MAMFGKSAFNASSYAAFRPTYPRQLFDTIFSYHERSPAPKWDTAVDLGCGTGQATTELTPFKRVIGVDPSVGMLNGARQYLSNSPKYEFVESKAEELGFLHDGCVDLIISAQASHWFNWTVFWPECARVLRKGGSAALWTYSEFRFTHYPALTPLIAAYTQGTDPETSLGPHWQQPGRSVLDNHMLDVPDASSVVPGAFSESERIFFAGSHYPSLPSPRPVILRKTLTWTDLLSYFRTMSPLYTYHERFPEDKALGDSEDDKGDIAVRFWRSLKEGVMKEGGNSDGDVELEWPLALILVRRV